jgi:class 3 adenylate cyclase/tetratricopeptide (TPR) repeat protein
VTRNKEAAERQQLQTLLKAIIPYLPQPVVEEQLTDPVVGRVRGEYWEGSVLFADLSGFTALSETLSKLGKEGVEVITDIVNGLFEALLEDVERYGGVLLKFGGDAMTVYFGGANHALRATRAGLAMQETMDRRFVNLDTPGGVFTLRLRVGVHTGRIFAAQVGYEPGYRLRGMELVVTGADINRVAEAQDYAAPGDVCITAEMLLPVTGQAAVEPLAGGMYRLQILNPAVPLETPPRTTIWSPSADDPLPLLRLRTEALRPYLPVDISDQRITDPSNPELQPNFKLAAVLFANFADLSGILATLADKNSAGVQAATKILNTYYTRMQDIIGRYGGVINKVDMYTHGDKLMAIFGAPLAHGDDAERAVRAALEMQAAMPQVNQYIQQTLEEIHVPCTPLTQRIGINYGHVFAGNVGSEREGSRREYTVMGDTVNLAARLMAAAQEGQVLISPTVRRWAADKFLLEDLPPIRVKGKADSIPISSPLRPLTEPERTALRREQRPFVGRAEQLHVMRQAIERVIAGHGQVVVVTGEAGAGKTRLVEAFQDQTSSPELEQQPGSVCFVTELPSYAQEPYAPIIDLLRRLLGLSGDSTEDIQRLTEWLTERVPELDRFLPLLGNLLALPIVDNPVTAALTPEQRHDRLYDVIEAALHSEAGRRPLVLVVDDLQWSDESSLALLERLARSLTRAPLMLVLCYRPDVPFATPWADLPFAQTIQVVEFTPAESAQFVAELLAAEELDAGLAEMVWSRAQGNPFFTEEFVKSLRETGSVVGENGRWRLASEQLAVTTIPDTIEGIVLARLDRLEARCRDVLQEASVAAASQPRFAQPLLERVDPYPVELSDRLHRLVADGLLEALESELEAFEYHFRHALTREVAYDSLLYARRRELHRFIAQGIETLYTDRLDEYVTSLAHHYLEAEEWAQAFRFQRRAGERAQGLFANKNAIAYFRRALTLAETELPEMLAAFEPSEFVDALSDIHEHLGDVLVLEGRHDEALETFAAARNLLIKGNPPERMAKFCRKTAEVYERKADFTQALEWLERGLGALGERDVVEKARIYNFGGGVFYRQGQREKALEWRERALQIAERLGDQSEIANAYLIMAVIYSDWGDLDRALTYGQRCLEAYEAAGDLAGSVKGHNNVGIISRKADRWTKALEHFQEGLRLSEMMNDGFSIGQFANGTGNVYLDQGKLTQATEAYQRAISVWEPIGLLAGVTVARINLGKAAVTQGDLRAGKAHLDEAQRLAQEIGARGFLPEIFHWQAILHLERGQLAEALALAQQAHNLAQELKDRAEEGGALRVLGRVYAAMEQPEPAIAHLQASLACFKDLQSSYQTAKTCFELAQIYLTRPDLRKEGYELLEKARSFFAELGAAGDLAQVEKVSRSVSM